MDAKRSTDTQVQDRRRQLEKEERLYDELAVLADSFMSVGRRQLGELLRHLAHPHQTVIRRPDLQGPRERGALRTAMWALANDYVGGLSLSLQQALLGIALAAADAAEEALNVMLNRHTNPKWPKWENRTPENQQMFLADVLCRVAGYNSSSDEFLRVHDLSVGILEKARQEQS